MFIELKTTTGSIHIRPELFSDIGITRNDKDNILKIWFTYVDGKKQDCCKCATQEEFDLFIQRLNEYFETLRYHEIRCCMAKG